MVLVAHPECGGDPGFRRAVAGGRRREFCSVVPRGGDGVREIDGTSPQIAPGSSGNLYSQIKNGRRSMCFSLPMMNAPSDWKKKGSASRVPALPMPLGVSRSGKSKCRPGEGRRDVILYKFHTPGHYEP